MSIVYPLWHVHEFEDGTEDVKLIGIYSSEEKAKAAIERVADQPGFRDLPDSFQIEPHQVDRDNWIEGFVGD